MRGARRRARRRRAARHRAHRRDHRDHRSGWSSSGLAYAAERRRLLRGAAASPATASSRASSIDDLEGRRARRGRRAQAQPARLRALEGRQARRAVVGAPWGPGRPGWHIECSAMAHRYLGEPFDIHGGGVDLIFPHHENEIAQSEGAFGDGQFARYWMHTGMVNFGGEKMSKSLGNVVTIRKVAETHDLEALRLLFIGVHYRSPVGFTIGARRRGARRLSGARRGRGAARLLLPDAGAAGGGAAAAPTTCGRGRCRRPTRRCASFQRGDGRRLQHRRRHRAPLRSRSCWPTSCSTSRRPRPRTCAGGRWRACAATCSSAARRWASSSATPAAFLLARRERHLRAPRHRPGRRRGAHRRARRPPAPPRTSPAPTRSADAAGERHRADGQPERHHLARGVSRPQASGFGLQALRSRNV